MTNAVDQLRKTLSEKLRSAMLNNDRELIRTLRGIMSIVDNAGALSKDEISQLDPSITEVPRKDLNRDELLALLQNEISFQEGTAEEFQKIGKPEQVEKIRQSIAVIQELRGKI